MSHFLKLRKEYVQNFSWLIYPSNQRDMMEMNKMAIQADEIKPSDNKWYEFLLKKILEKLEKKTQK